VRGVALVRACALLPIVELLRERGLELEPLLRSAGLPPTSLGGDPEGLVPQHLASRLLLEASRREGLAGVAFLAAERISLATFGEFGRLLLHSASLGEALETAVRAQLLYSSGGRMRLVRDGERSWLRHVPDRRITAGREQAEQWTLLLAIQFVRLVADPDWRPLEIELRASAAPGADGLELLKQARIGFGLPCTGLAIPQQLLRSPLRRPADAIASREAIERRLEASAPASDFAGSIRQVVRTLLPNGYPHLARTASAIAMSVRTLQRRLGESGVSYSGLVEEERFFSALRLLAHPRASVTDVAIRLGYSDLANFSHAFQRWAGMAPSRFRRELRAAAQSERVISNTIRSGRTRFQRQSSSSPCWLAMRLIQPSVVQHRSSG
jgi:AraC-like DNA-binding protein